MKNRGRYKTSHLPEDQYEPGSDKRVLQNLLGIKKKAEMERAETVALKQTEDFLLQKNFFDRAHRFIAKDICQIHEIWLGKIYPWAGQYRNVDLTKGNFRFPHARYISRLMETFEKEFLSKYTPCANRSKEHVVQALAYVHVELILIHPFREGNGRVARILATLMALQAGYPPLDFRVIQHRGNKSYIAAIHEGLDKNYSLMEKIFERVIGI